MSNIPNMNIHETEFSNLRWGTAGISADAKDIANEKFEISKGYADEMYTLTKDFIADISSYFDRITGDIDTDIPIDELDIELPEDILALLKDAPINPVTQSDYDSIVVPDGLTWNFSREAYTSSLLDALKTDLENIIETRETTGIDEVEEDIWDRETERDALANEDAKTKAAANWSKRNAEQPSMGLFSSLSQIDKEYQNKRLDKSRAIAEESRKLEIAARQKAWEEANKLEATLHDFWMKWNDLSLRANEAVVKYALEILNAHLAKLKAKVEIYSETVKAFVAEMSARTEIIRAYIAVMDAKVRYAMAKIEARAKELDAEIKLLSMKYGLWTDGAKAQASIAAQIAASAMGAVGVQVGLDARYSEQFNQSQSTSEDYQHSENYNLNISSSGSSS